MAKTMPCGHSIEHGECIIGSFYVCKAEGCSGEKRAPESPVGRPTVVDIMSHFLYGYTVDMDRVPAMHWECEHRVQTRASTRTRRIRKCETCGLTGWKDLP